MHAALLILPILVYALTTFIFLRLYPSRGAAEAFVKAHLVVFALVALSTEVLSLFELITPLAVLSVWVVFVVVCFCVLKSCPRRPVMALAPWRRGQGAVSGLFFVHVFLLLAATLAAALLYPPNTWDSMTYHLSRVMHWISNGTVSFYPTQIIRQNYQMPLAEFALLHIHALTQSDLFSGLVQWISYMATVFLAMLIAAEFQLSQKQQVVSAIIVASLPMAILQASSTQNDLVLSAFMASFALFMLRIRQNESLDNYFFASISLGLALLTKGTAYPFCAMLGISLAVPAVLKHRSSIRKMTGASMKIALVALFAVLLNLGHLSRNHQLYESPFPAERAKYQNEERSFMALSSNMARNFAMHLSSPSGQWNDAVNASMNAVFAEELHNPETTWPGTRFEISYASCHEDFAGNLVHAVVLLAVGFILPLLWLAGRFRDTLWYALGILGAFLLFSLVFKWQPWATRLHTPLFVLAGPLAAIVLTAWDSRTARRFGMLLLCVFMAQSLPYALANNSRSILGLDWLHKDRGELYFQTSLCSV